MNTWEILATVVTAWVILLGTCWFVFIAIARWKALQASDARKRLAIEKGVALQERMLGGMAEGRGPVPGDDEEAAAEIRAIKRMRGV